MSAKLVFPQEHWEVQHTHPLMRKLSGQTQDENLCRARCPWSEQPTRSLHATEHASRMFFWTGKRMQFAQVEFCIGL